MYHCGKCHIDICHQFWARSFLQLLTSLDLMPSQTKISPAKIDQPSFPCHVTFNVVRTHFPIYTICIQSSRSAKQINCLNIKSSIKTLLLFAA